MLKRKLSGSKIRSGGKFHLSRNFYCRMSMTRSNYTRQVFRGNAPIVQKQATQYLNFMVYYFCSRKRIYDLGEHGDGKMKVKRICNRLRRKALLPLGQNKQRSKSSSTNQLSRSGEATNSLVARFCARCQWREKF